MAWSFDSRWLAYGYSNTPQTTAIKLGQLESGETTLATQPTLRDTRPGVRSRGQVPVLHRPARLRPGLRRAAFRPRLPQGLAAVRDHAAQGPAQPVHSATQAAREPGSRRPEEGGSRRRAAGAAAHRDRAGRHHRSRRWRSPCAEARYGRIEGIKGKALFSSYPIEGARGRSRPRTTTARARGTLESYDLETQKQERLVDGISDFWIGRDGKTLLYQPGDRLRVLEGGRKGAREEGRQARPRERLDRPGSGQSLDPASGRVAADVPGGLASAARAVLDGGPVGHRLGRRASAVPAAGRARHHALGVLGPAVGDPGRAGHVARLRDGRRVPAAARTTARAFSGSTGSSMPRRARIASRTSSAATRGMPMPTSPLTGPGVNLAEGDQVLAINGQPLGPEVTPGAAAGQSGRQRGAADRPTRRRETEPRTVTVKALGDERPARYRDWVEANRAQGPRRRPKGASATSTCRIWAPKATPSSIARSWSSTTATR